MAKLQEADWTCCICLRKEYGFANGCIFLHNKKAHPVCFSLNELTMERMFADDQAKYIARAEELYGEITEKPSDLDDLHPPKPAARMCSVCSTELKEEDCEVTFANCIHGSEHLSCARSRCYMRRFFYCNECPCDPRSISEIVQAWCGLATKEVNSVYTQDDSADTKQPAGRNILTMVEGRVSADAILKWFSGVTYMVGDALAATVAKAVAMELNRRALQKNAPFANITPLMLFIANNYSGEDCIKMGLVFEMVCDNAADWKLLLNSQKFSVYALRRLGCTFLNMLFAGVTLDQLRDARYTVKELDDLGFNGPAFVAVNGTMRQLVDIIKYSDDENGKALGARFGFTKDMLEMLSAGDKANKK